MSGQQAVYTHGHHEAAVRSYYWRNVQNSAAYLIPRLTPGVRVLDVGCGPGSITADLADRVAPGTVTAIDSAPEALAWARETVGSRSNVEFRLGDVHALDFADASFDLVHAHQLLQHVTDPVAALREMRRVTRPGGVVAARDGDFGSFTWYPEYGGVRAWLDLYGQVSRRNGGQPDAGRRLLAWAHAAGLHDVTSSSSTWTFATPDERAWWATTWVDRLQVTGLGDQAIRYGFATAGDIAAMVDGWREWAADPDAWFMAPSGEILATA
jgi:SAM-dependent methyltransferase